MYSPNFPTSRRADLVVQELNDEIIIYDLITDKAFCLNQTSALVWQFCNGKTSVAEISRKVAKQFDRPPNEDVIWLALEQLKEQNLLDDAENFASQFAGISRREAFRRAGLGTLIALPLITTLIAPKAVNAQSVACSGSCTCSVSNTINLTTGINCRTLGGTSNCASRLTCDCLVTASSTNGTCVGT